MYRHVPRRLHLVKAETKKIERAMSSEFQNFISTNLHTSRISLQLIWNNCWIIPMVRGQIKVRPAPFAKRFLIPNVKICGNEILKFRWHCPLNLFCFSFDSVKSTLGSVSVSSFKYSINLNRTWNYKATIITYTCEQDLVNYQYLCKEQCYC